MKQHYGSDRLSTAVFLIGLAVLLVTGWWFPGILFVIAASMIVGGLEKPGQMGPRMTGALMMIGIGVVFGLPGFLAGINWKLIIGVIFLLIALSMIFGGKGRHRQQEADEYEDDFEDEDDDKRKNGDDDDYV